MKFSNTTLRMGSEGTAGSLRLGPALALEGPCFLVRERHENTGFVFFVHGVVGANAKRHFRPEGPTDTSRGLQPPDPTRATCAAKPAPETSGNHFGHRSISDADFAAHSHLLAIRGLKPPASGHRPFGPEVTFGIRSKSKPRLKKIRNRRISTQALVEIHFSDFVARRTL